MNAEFKRLKADCIDAFVLEIQEIHGVVPEEFAETWVEKHWGEFEDYARAGVIHAIADAIRSKMRSKCTVAICEQLHLPGEEFADLPIAVPTENDGYAGAGLATVADWELSIAEHRKQIEGHDASIVRIQKHIADRRSMGIPDDVGWYENVK
jgi:hypothetical protein